MRITALGLVVVIVALLYGSVALGQAPPTQPPDSSQPAAAPGPVTGPAAGSVASPPPSTTPSVSSTASAPPAPERAGSSESVATTTTNAAAGSSTGSVASTADGSTAPDCRLGGACAIGDLKTPASPAFALIAVTPESVERPTTPKSVALAIYNAFGNRSLPEGFALEFAPYWLFPHPELTFDDYRVAMWEQLAFNTSISVATASAPEAANGDGQLDLAFGARTHMDLLRPEDRRTKDAREKLLEIARAAALKQGLEDADNKCDTADESPVCEQYRIELAKLPNRDADPAVVLADATAAYKAALEAKAKFVVELAGAFALRSPSEDIDLKTHAGGAWLTVGWLRLGDSAIDLLGVGRYLDSEVAEGEANAKFADLGGRLGVLWQDYKLGVHIEALHRIVLDAPDSAAIDDSQRVAGTVELGIGHGIYISATFGKEADSEDGEGGLFTLAGVSFQASDAPTVKIPGEDAAN